MLCWQDHLPRLRRVSLLKDSSLNLSQEIHDTFLLLAQATWCDAAASPLCLTWSGEALIWVWDPMISPPLWAVIIILPEQLWQGGNVWGLVIITRKKFSVADDIQDLELSISKDYISHCRRNFNPCRRWGRWAHREEPGHIVRLFWNLLTPQTLFQTGLG